MIAKPALYLYNTMSRSKEPFVPIDGVTARVYSCGPTVYGTAHVGNMRTYIFMDCLRRVLKHNGYKLLHVMNITDVGHLVSDEDFGEDKMIKGARERNKTPWEIAEEYTRIFMDDAAALNIEIPGVVSKATDHIPQMLEMVERLVEKGYAYELSDGIYYDIGAFDEYGKLSGLDLNEQRAGARIEVNTEKRHPADFALWIKAPEEHIMQWDSKWGAGYPGWHIECSAMSMHYLGDQIDIHTGGVDHIPIHHENEIAQSDAYAGKRVVSRWMHGEFLLMDGGRMSKSLKNLYTLEDLKERGYDPLVFRYFCLNAHYRSKLNYTWEGMQSASVAYRRFVEGALAHRDAGAPRDGVESGYLEEMSGLFDAAVNDDLNIPKALGVAWQLIRSADKSGAVFELLLKMDKILGFGLAEAAAAQSSAGHSPAGQSPAGHSGDTRASASGAPAYITGAAPQEILDLVHQRDEARAAKDWARSDELRNIIKDKGFAVIDSKQGSKIEIIHK